MLELGRSQLIMSDPSGANSRPQQLGLLIVLRESTSSGAPSGSRMRKMAFFSPYTVKYTHLPSGDQKGIEKTPLCGSSSKTRHFEVAKSYNASLSWPMESARKLR